MIVSSLRRFINLSISNQFSQNLDGVVLRDDFKDLEEVASELLLNIESDGSATAIGTTSIDFFKNEGRNGRAAVMASNFGEDPVTVASLIAVSPSSDGNLNFDIRHFHKIIEEDNELKVMCVSNNNAYIPRTELQNITKRNSYSNLFGALEHFDELNTNYLIRKEEIKTHGKEILSRLFQFFLTEPIEVIPDIDLEGGYFIISRLTNDASIKAILINYVYAPNDGNLPDISPMQVIIRSDFAVPAQTEYNRQGEEHFKGVVVNIRSINSPKGFLSSHY
ncbi:MAG: hypothetical protein Q9M91_01830 [Candidatus Dojkabacteria bacterium]|nr:hypothetical protein [Candidatus Dojkabacteria bacterium]MDQ7020564.1 hypothetical protein [Candidatus Dojkabacteria bacterium]